jgi:predicted HD phosphohydrolase
MKANSRAYNRDVSRRKALRKKRITEEVFYGCSKEHPYYDNLHQFSKCTLQCSCGMCMAKTRNKKYRRRHIHANYAPSINYKISDKRKVEAMAADIDEYMDASE